MKTYKTQTLMSMRSVRSHSSRAEKVLMHLSQNLKANIIRDDDLENLKEVSNALREELRKLYNFTFLMFVKYYRYSKKHKQVLFGLYLVYWLGDYPYKYEPNVYSLVEDPNEKEVDQVIEKLQNIDAKSIVKTMQEKVISFPFALMSEIHKNEVV